MEDVITRVQRSYIELAKLFGKKALPWLPAWLGAVSISNAKYDVLNYARLPYRAERREQLAKQTSDIQLAIQSANAAGDLRLIDELRIKLSSIEHEDRGLRGKDGKAKRGPNKSEITPQILIAARLVEIFRYVNGRYPSPKNKKMAAALISFLETLGLRRDPFGDPLNGQRRTFETALRSNVKEVVIQRLLTKRSLEQTGGPRGRVPWILAGMNGPVAVYKP